jgi:predicted metal-dependent enzyme (double-stranded beta helix superfamily)
MGNSLFEMDQFVADCRAALGDPHPQKAVCDLVARAVDDVSRLIPVLGEPQQGGIQTLHQSGDLTILNVVWAPDMTILPHNHEMWAVIGVYTGRENNIFWKRLEGEPGRIEAAGAKSLGRRDAVPLGRDIIHSVTNPISRLTGAIHIYGGDFFTTPRSEWDPETLEERPYNLENNSRLFRDSDPGGK